jgi:von Willebrand factor type A domain
MHQRAPYCLLDRSSLMRGRLGERCVLAVLLAGLAMALLAPTSQAGSENPAVESYGSCLLGRKEGDLLLLIDESASLEKTDPDAARVAAARYFVDQMADLGERLSIDLSVNIAAFSDNYHEVLGWTALDRTGAGRADSALQEFRDRTKGVQTDYWSGLNGARKALKTKTAGSDSQRCQALVWFSDGQFSVTLTESEWQQHPGARKKPYAPKADLRKAADAEQAKEAATADLCRRGGLADQLRIGGINLFALGLTSPGGASASDFDTMLKIATGSKGCGKRAEPPGSFTPASNVDDLLRAFNKIREQPPIEDERSVCQASDVDKCRKSGHSFVLDNSIRSVHILASSDVAEADVYLFYPKGSEQKRHKLTRKNKDLLPRGSSYQWITERSLTIDLVNRSREADPWTGQWTVVFHDPTKNSVSKKSTVDISIAGNLRPTWPGLGQTPLRTGDVLSDLTFGLTDDQDNPVDSESLLGTGSFDAQLVKPDGGMIDIASTMRVQDVSSKKHTLDLTGVPVGRAELKLSLDLTTAAFRKIPGTRLTPQVASIPVEILPALGMPVLDDGIDFGTIEGPVDETATLGVTGPGCVWLPGDAGLDAQTEPEGIGQMAISSEANAAASCLKVPEGQHGQLTLRLTTTDGGNGTLAGTIPVAVAPLDRPDKATTVAVPFTADLQKPVKPFNFALALAAALLLGPAIPLLLLWAFKWMTAKIPGQPLLARDIPVTIVGKDVLRDGAPLALRDTDFRDLVRLKDGGSRTAEIPGGMLRTRTGWSPFGMGFVIADLPGRIGLSSTYPQPYGRAQLPRLPVAVHNTWLVSRDPAGSPNTAALVLLVGNDPQRYQAIVDDVKARLPDLMPLLGGTVADKTRPSDPFGSMATASVAAEEKWSFDSRFDNDNPGSDRY